VGRKPFFVVNPHSARLATGRRWPEWWEVIQRRMQGAEFALTQGPMHAVELSRSALERGFDLVVAVGGDGTLNEVLNGFFSSGKPRLPGAALSYLPNGTGADFARTMGLRGLTIEQRVQRFASAPQRMLDCVEAQFTSFAGERVSRLYINESSLGFSAETASAVNRASRHFRGKLPFLIGVVRCLSNLHNPLIRIGIDGQQVYEESTLMVAISNGKYFGGSMMIAPHAEVDDGLLDIIIVRAMSRLTVMAKIQKIYRGEHLDEPEVVALRGSNIEAAALQEEVPLELDGEQPGKLAASYHLTKAMIPFLA
jgi:diacylglycerol kinase (ATP)